GWTLSDSYRYLKGDVRAEFLTSLEEFLTKWTFFDGIDIDWETPRDAAEGEDYVALLKDVREVLDRVEIANNKTYLLSSAVFSAKKNIDRIDYSEAVKYLDYVFAMTYDYHGAFDREIGFHSNLFSKDDVTEENSVITSLKNFNAAGVPKDKLHIGIASYGRSVVLGSNDDLSNSAPLTGTNSYEGYFAGIGTGERGVMEWYDVYNRFWPGNPNLNVEWSDITIGTDTVNAPRVNGFYYLTDGLRNADFFYNPDKKLLFDTETPRTAYNKAKVTEQGLAGAFFWVMEYDNEMIVAAIHEGLGNQFVRTGVNEDVFRKIDADIAVRGGSAIPEQDWPTVTGSELDEPSDRVALTGSISYDTSEYAIAGSTKNYAVDSSLLNQGTGILSYAHSVSEPGISVDRNTGLITVSSQVAVGSYSVAIIVSSDHGGSAEITVNIKVISDKVVTATQSSTGENRPASNTLDGDLNTFSHTNYGSNTDNVRHWLKYQFNEPKKLNGLTIFNRIDFGSRFIGARIAF
ncbi:MAG: discoidin domain-containing protein, partial [Methylococcales bacterium]|nr:discoidin domain-containing protein [Methylococcales bacterium]